MNNFNENAKQASPSAIRELGDSALLRYGIVARFLCDPETEYKIEPRESVMATLEEVRREWKRRHPKLPLSDSLG